MDWIETLKGNSAIKILILIPLIFALALRIEENQSIDKASRTTRKDGSSILTHSLITASVDSTHESENAMIESQSVLSSPNRSINESVLAVAHSENFTIEEMRMNVNTNTSTLVPSPAPTVTPKIIAKPQQEIFSYTRNDRSGAAIHDMLMCHALAFSNGWKYAGACRRRNSKLSTATIRGRKKLLNMLGVEFHMFSKCPRGAKIVQGFDYYGKPELFSQEYLDHLRSTSTPAASVISPRVPRIAVHVRRGDVKPCGKNDFRYLPNQHYLTLIETYTEKLTQRMKQQVGANYTSNEIEVLIFSESKSYESFDVFRELGFKVVLDSSIEEVWDMIIFNSDVIILSLSSFSMLPGILSLALSPDPTTVVYTPFWHDPLPQFDNVEDLYPELLNSTTEELEILNSTCRKNKGKNPSS